MNFILSVWNNVAHLYLEKSKAANLFIYPRTREFQEQCGLWFLRDNSTVILYITEELVNQYRNLNKTCWCTFQMKHLMPVVWQPDHFCTEEPLSLERPVSQWAVKKHWDHISCYLQGRQLNKCLHCLAWDGISCHGHWVCTHYIISKYVGMYMRTCIYYYVHIMYIWYIYQPNFGWLYSNGDEI